MRPRAAVLLALAVAMAAVGGCRSRQGVERREVFRQVTAPVAFEMLLDFPNLPVLDLRPAADFHGEHGHIRGAINVPSAHLGALLRDIASLRDHTFLIYCWSDECGEELDFLRANGFDNAMLLHGGIEAWMRADFGTVGAFDPPDHRDVDEGAGDREEDDGGEDGDDDGDEAEDGGEDGGEAEGGGLPF